MILRGVELVGEAGGPRRVRVAGGRISEVGAMDDRSERAPTGETVLDLDQTIAFPGLTNSHDHLEFNLYPPFARRPYEDYLEWAEDLQSHDRAAIDSVERVPRDLRVRWGALKNLLCGVTTVAHHGDAYQGAAPLLVATTPGTCLHSVHLGRRWRWTLNAPADRSPYVVHVAEGRSAAARREADTLLRWNLFRRPLVGVHAIALPPERAAGFRALVWCPVSNELLYGVAADPAPWRGRTTILVGTDSTLTADWNFWNHLRRARALRSLDDRAIFDAVTRDAATLWGRAAAGSVRTGQVADVVVARKRAPGTWDAFFAVDPQDILLVLVGGSVALCDASLAPLAPSGRFSRVRVGDSQKLVAEDVPALLSTIRRFGVAINLPIATEEPSGGSSPGRSSPTPR